MLLLCPLRLKSLCIFRTRPFTVPTAQRRQLSVLQSTQQGEQGHQQQDPMPKFELIEESVAYKRYLTLFDRQVRVTSEKTGQVTMIREFCQGPNAVCYNLPTGGFDPAKHTSIEDCARAELSEEALLKGGELVRLIPEDHPGFAEVKWCANRFVPFLVIDPHVDPKPGARDAEEFIEVKRVGMEEFRNLNDGGDLMLPSMVTANLALKYLEKRGFV